MSHLSAIWAAAHPDLDDDTIIERAALWKRPTVGYARWWACGF